MPKPSGTSVERATGAPLEVELNGTMVQFKPLGPTELGLIKQRIRAQRVSAVREAFQDRMDGPLAAEALKQAVQGPVLSDEIDAFTQDLDGVMYSLYLSMTAAGGTMSWEEFIAIDAPDGLWVEVLAYLWNIPVKAIEEMAAQAAAMQDKLAGKSSPPAGSGRPTGDPASQSLPETPDQ